jgi:hypothetical protein
LELSKGPRRLGEKQTTSRHRQSCQCRHELEKLGAPHEVILDTSLMAS